MCQSVRTAAQASACLEKQKPEHISQNVGCQQQCALREAGGCQSVGFPKHPRDFFSIGGRNREDIFMGWQQTRVGGGSRSREVGPVDRPGIAIIDSVGVGLVSRNEKHLTGCNSKSAAIHFRPALSFGAKNQNRFIKAVRPANSMQTRLGIPAEAFDMQANTERVTPDLA